MCKFSKYIQYLQGIDHTMPMVNPNPPHHSTICYRPIQPADLEILEQIHTDLFPIRYIISSHSLTQYVLSTMTYILVTHFSLHRYESEFFQNVVNGHDIVSWAAVDRSRPNGQSDELIGFVTARIVLVKESEVSHLQLYLFFFLEEGLGTTTAPLNHNRQRI